jgi:hypothetical protein
LDETTEQFETKHNPSDHWRIGLALSRPAQAFWPDRIMTDDLNAIGLLGAVLVVTGSMLAALGGRQRNVGSE